MSQPDKEPDKAAPVTLGTLEMILKSITDQFNDAFSKRDAQIEARFNQFASVLQQVAEKVQQPLKQAAESSAPLDKNEIIQKAADKILDRLMGDNDAESDMDFQQYKRNIHTLYNLGIKRSIQATDKIIKKELTGSAASDKLAEKMIAADLVGHGPA